MLLVFSAGLTFVDFSKFGSCRVDCTLANDVLNPECCFSQYSMVLLQCLYFEIDTSKSPPPSLFTWKTTELSPIVYSKRLLLNDFQTHIQTPDSVCFNTRGFLVVVVWFDLPRHLSRDL